MNFEKGDSELRPSANNILPPIVRESNVVSYNTVTFNTDDKRVSKYEVGFHSSPI